MKLLKSIYLSIVFLLILMPVFADKPVQTLPTGESMFIFYPKTQYYPYGQEIELSFNVLNSSYHELTGDDVSCFLWVERSDGSKLLNGVPLNYSSYFYYILNETQTSHRGHHNYYLRCNNSLETGAVSTGYEINGAGEEPLLSTILSYLAFFSIILFGLVISVTTLFSSKKFIPQFISANFMWYLLLLFTWMLWNFSYNFFVSFTPLIDISRIIFLLFSFGSIPFFVLSVVMLFVYVLSNKTFQQMAESGFSANEIKQGESNWLFKLMWGRYK